MSRRIEIQLNEDGGRVMERVRATAKNYGAQLVGDDERGQFSGKGIQGTYEIVGDRLAVIISKKPLIMPWGVIENTVRKFFT